MCFLKKLQKNFENRDFYSLKICLFLKQFQSIWSHNSKKVWHLVIGNIFKNIYDNKYFWKKTFFFESWDQILWNCSIKDKFWDFKKSLFSKSFVNFSEDAFTKTFTSNSGLNLMAYRAVDCHNIMGGTHQFRVEELKLWTYFPIPSHSN